MPVSVRSVALLGLVKLNYAEHSDDEKQQRTNKRYTTGTTTKLYCSQVRTTDI